MSQESIVLVFHLFMGGLGILGSIFWKQLSQAFGQRPMSESFTNPRFQRSAQIREFLGRLFLAVFGMAWLAQGLGNWLFPTEAANLILWILVGISGAIFLGIVGVIVFYWRGE